MKLYRVKHNTCFHKFRTGDVIHRCSPILRKRLNGLYGICDKGAAWMTIDNTEDGSWVVKLSDCEEIQG